MIKVRSLGTVSAAARGIVISDGTNASPIVATVTALHRLKNGDRLAVAGVTTLTAMNGEFSVSSVGATAATLDGSVGNGAYAGTAVVAQVMDRTPHMQRHSACLLQGDVGLAAIFIGTIVCEGADSIDATGFFYTNSSGVATAGLTSVLTSGEIALPAQTVVGGGMLPTEVQLKKYMTMRCSAYTSGSAVGALLA